MHIKRTLEGEASAVLEVKRARTGKTEYYRVRDGETVEISKDEYDKETADV